MMLFISYISSLAEGELGIWYSLIIVVVAYSYWKPDIQESQLGNITLL